MKKYQATFWIVFASTFLFGASACRAERARLPEESGYGANPTLLEPQKTLIPTVHVADAIGWSEGQAPQSASGFEAKAFARNLEHPRWLYVLPNGDVLVAETNAPPKPEDSKGVKGFFTKMFMKRAGAVTESANRITLLRDTDNDGVSEIRTTFIENLNSPFGMALIGTDFYVANTDSIIRFPYQDGQTHISDLGEKIIDLPAGTLNHHWTKSMVADPSGKYLYVGVGSNSNAAENGIEREKNRAAILKVDIAARTSYVFASGLRNPVGMDWQPETGTLWASVNERDALGSDLVPDYMTSIQENDFYGWPYSYYGSHVDTRVKPQRPDMVAKAIKPDFALGSHTASLGLTFYDGGLFPKKYDGGVFIGQHGSWNRNPPSGYKVIFIPFRLPAAMPEDFLTGFLSENGDALGRPVGVIVDGRGALLVADDVGNIIWRVTPVE